jgi:hypothetical protein
MLSNIVRSRPKRIIEIANEFRGVCLNANTVDDYFKHHIEPYPCLRVQVVNDTLNALLRTEMPEPGLLPWFAQTQAQFLDYDELLFTYNLLMMRREYQRAGMILNAFPPVAAAAAERPPYAHLA